MTDNDFEQLAALRNEQQTMTLDEYHALVHPSRSKYGNTRVRVDGILFDSLAEARRYRELKLLQAAGTIAGLMVHPRFVLQEAFIYHGERIGAIVYEADFQYIDRSCENRVTIEDIKGVETQAFGIKRKLFLKRYPELQFVRNWCELSYPSPPAVRGLCRGRLTTFAHSPLRAPAPPAHRARLRRRQDAVQWHRATI